MSNIQVVFWSQSGNTEAMANAVADGIRKAGKEADVVFVSDASIDELKSAKVFALGCPAMGAEVLEEGEMEPFVSDLEMSVSGKTIGLFGSYGWGGGDWMGKWLNNCRGLSAKLVSGGVACCGEPDGDALTECVNLGRALAQ